MKIAINIQSAKVQFFLESENYNDVRTLVRIGNSIKKPIRSFGSIYEDRTWLYIDIPTKIGEYEFTKIGNEK